MTLYEQAKEKIQNPEDFSKWLCGLMELTNGQCDGCPARDYCEYNYNGFKDLLKKQTGELWEEC